MAFDSLAAIMRMVESPECQVLSTAFRSTDSSATQLGLGADRNVSLEEFGCMVRLYDLSSHLYVSRFMVCFACVGDDFDGRDKIHAALCNS